MTNRNIDDIFNAVDAAILSSQRVYKNTSTARVFRNSAQTNVRRNTENRVLPTVEDAVEKTIYKSRYTHFVQSVKHLNYKNYPDTKRSGFDSAINTYLDLANANQKNFKVLDERLLKDLADCREKIVQSADQYLYGYSDGLAVIKKLLNMSKITRFQELTGKLN